MKGKKLLIGLVIVLAIGLVFQTGYLIGKSRQARAARQARITQEQYGLDPFTEMQRMHRKMDRMFRDSFGRMMHHPDFGMFQQRLSFEPMIDVIEKQNEYVVTVDLPGVDKDRVNVEARGNILTISGERRLEKEKIRGKGFYKAERNFGSFSRTITLPGEVEAEDITATSAQGVLVIKLPKKTKKEKEQQPGIKIKIE